MKKFFYGIAILSVAVLAVNACKKGTPEEPKIQKRITMCGDQWDKYYFTYNTDGTIKDVERNPSNEAGWGGYERIWNFVWVNNVGTAKYTKEGEEQGEWIFTLNDKGYLSTFANEWGDTWGFTYDASGYLTKIVRVDKDNAVKTNCSWSNGDLKKWSRMTDDGEQWKIQSFLNDENVGGIFADACDKADVARWIFELGFCGKPSKHLLDEAVWEGAEDSAVHTYQKDADGFVTKVNKVYGTDDPEIYEYVWETISK